MSTTLADPLRLRQPARHYHRWGAAVASGLLQSLAFPPVGASWGIFAALVPLFWAAYAPAVEGETPLTFRRQFLLGFVAEGVFFMALLHWILFLSNEEVTIPGIMIPSLLFISAYLAVFFALAVGLGGALERAGGGPAAASLPVLWTLADHLRGIGTLAFPWGSVGYALARHPAALQISAWTGFWGIGLWILAVNGLLFAALLALQQGRRIPAVARLGGALLAGVAPVFLGMGILAQAPPQQAEPQEGLRLALVQPNTPREIKWKDGYEGMVVDDLLTRTRQAAATDPDLIVWPETAAPLMILWEPELASRVRENISEIQQWVLVGTLDAVLIPGGQAESYNAAILYDPEGIPVQRYYKRRLVPFSEAMPFQKQIPWINALNFGQSDFTAGRAPDLFRVHGVRFSVLICFESIFPELSRDAVRGGAQVLINTTNDFWFGRSAGPVQHAEMAIHRAVENRTPLARCANSGISFFVDPYGRVSQETGLFVAALPVARLASGRGGSFYTRHGEWLTTGLLLLALVSVGQALWMGRHSMRRSRRSRP